MENKEAEMKENISLIVAILGGIYTIANLVVRLTPTQKDNMWLKKHGTKIQKILTWLDKIFTISNRKIGSN